MVAFLRHHGVPWLAPEALGFLWIGCAIGAALGVLCLVGGRNALSIVTAVLVIASIDAQSDYFTAWNAELGWHFAGVCAVALVLRDFLTRALPAIGAAMLVAATLSPATPDVARTERELDPADPSLPLVLHLVLDEHIGIEGIPREFDPNGELAAELSAFYSKQGFALHSRAFSRYFDTHDAIPALLNFDATLEPGIHLGGEADRVDGSFEHGDSLRSNAYFDAMRARGHSIHVYQTDYLDLCGGAGSQTVSRCYEYRLESPNRLRALAIPNLQKLEMLTAMYARLSVGLRELQRTYRDLRFEDLAGSSTPSGRVQGRVSSVSGRMALHALREDLRAPEPGGLYFAHIALPHYPYSYDRECNVRQPVSTWLNRGLDDSKGVLRNSEASRAVRYAAYLDQLRCTTRELAELFAQLERSDPHGNAQVIVHGDHGSRITRQKMRIDKKQREEARPARDYIDSFSTLFAARTPGAVAGVHRGVLPIDVLLDAYIETGSAPPTSHPEAEVLVRGVARRLFPVSLPAFAHGRVEGENAQPAAR